jgi:hypothetical protein
MGTFLRDGIVKTRKEHICHGCKKVIPKGSEVYSQTGIDDGIYTIYMCNDCMSYCGECIECYEMEEAFEGFVAECRAERERYRQSERK